jgi:hypothetical protein
MVWIELLEIWIRVLWKYVLTIEPCMINLTILIRSINVAVFLIKSIILIKVTNLFNLKCPTFSNFFIFPYNWYLFLFIFFYSFCHISLISNRSLRTNRLQYLIFHLLMKLIISIPKSNVIFILYLYMVMSFN